MSRFASDFLGQSPLLLLPLLALVLFVFAFVLVMVRVLRMKHSDANRLSRIPLDDQEVVEERSEEAPHG